MTHRASPWTCNSPALARTCRGARPRIQSPSSRVPMPGQQWQPRSSWNPSATARSLTYRSTPQQTRRRSSSSSRGSSSPHCCQWIPEAHSSNTPRSSSRGSRSSREEVVLAGAGDRMLGREAAGGRRREGCRWARAVTAGSAGAAVGGAAGAEVAEEEGRSSERGAAAAAVAGHLRGRGRPRRSSCSHDRRLGCWAVMGTFARRAVGTMLGGAGGVPVSPDRCSLHMTAPTVSSSWPKCKSALSKHCISKPMGKNERGPHQI